MKTVIIATNNQNKVREIKSIFPNSNIEFKTLKECGYTKDIVEDGDSFEANALIKAKTVALELGFTAISDDSGLEVDALGGAPGIYSARYAGYHADDEVNNQLLIKNLQGVENRTARYVCAICIFEPNGNYKITRATCEGKIIDTPQGEFGFGYDPYFYVEEYKKTLASVSLEEKNAISHRAKALRMLKEIVDEDFNIK